MKFNKALILAATVVSCASLYADEGNLLLGFSTTADTYADGKQVLDGEWYALVWSQDGKFDGLNIDCTPVDTNDVVIYVSSLAKDGHCPYVLFEIPTVKAKAYEKGVYEVYLLDTRNATLDQVAAANGENKPVINGLVASQTYKVSGSMGVSTSTAQVATNGTVWVESSVDEASIENYEPVKITAFKVEGAKVKISVANMLPGVKYNVKMGQSPSNMQTLAVEVPQTVTNPEFVLDESDARFFKVVRQPLNANK